eukprot:CAMPEP_0174846450 /NCGR_PEP_ID=MMETSP1114-20130205/12314_1 /TAXON_ID=312471 /ORGANISM="Neobodo designis, Strain CCAP 1951/1" /LENGTH=116 /DNA_ID=CAMNT_0016080713 /DNA_START=38 /DNA_END=384 /DNA_ORIENTATION=+
MMTVRTVVVVVAMLAALAAADAPVDGKVIKGKWRVAHGPSQLYASHFYEVHHYAPPSSTTFQFDPEDPEDMRHLAWGSEIDHDRRIIPDSCFEIDPSTDEPMTVEAGRDRFGGFER